MHKPIPKLKKTNTIHWIITSIFLFLSNYAYSQPVFLKLNTETNLRFEKIFYDQIEFQSNIKPFLISEIPSFDSLSPKLEIKKNNIFLDKLLNDNILENKSNQFRIYANPIVQLSPVFGNNPKEIINNYRVGLTIGGNIGKQFAFQFDGFYGLQSYTQDFVSRIDSSGIIPAYGKYLGKTSSGYQYASITGYLSYSPSKYFNLQTGIGGNFWGDGYRSLFLSDNSANYPFLKATVNIWRFKYLWLIGYLRDFNSDIPNNTLKSKLIFSHYLSWNATKWLNINFFESIVSNPVDSMGVTYFNIAYLNPVIFYRPVEFAGGSADNALLGFGFKLKLYKKYQFYGQVLFDEFVWAQMKSGNGWWGNKFGIQAGLKVFDLLNIKNLYLQIELNDVRPYTYSYSNSNLNYGNQFQPLAHPTGANFGETIILAHYHKNRFSVLAKAVISSAGLDIDSISYGQDIYKPYTHRQGDYNNKFLQGFKGNYYHIELKMDWLINPKLNHSIFVSIIKQNRNSSSSNFQNTCFSIGIRYLLRNDELDYL